MECCFPFALNIPWLVSEIAGICFPGATVLLVNCSGTVLITASHLFFFSFCFS